MATRIRYQVDRVLWFVVGFVAGGVVTGSMAMVFWANH